MCNKALHTSIEFREPYSVSNFDQLNGLCSPIEVNVFELLRDKGRLYEFGKRIICNDKHVSVLIKNMPEDENEKGKVRDYIAVLIEGMEARYRDILRQRLINTVMQQLQELAHRLVTMVEDDQKKKTEIIEKYSFELQMSFHTLDLTLEQEQHITEIINKMMQTREDIEEKTYNISEEVNEILSSMSGSLDNLQEEKQENPKKDSGDSVELF
jgi:plasmid stability protein